MAAPPDICFICEKTLNEGTVLTVKEKGLKTFRESSVKRNDGKSERFLRNLSSLVVHDACRKQYTNQKLIAASTRRGSDAAPLSSPSTFLRSVAPTFDFKQHCFLCNQKITAEFLMKQKKTRLCDREMIYDVQKLAMKDSILELARSRSDEWGETIIDRIQHVSDLVAVEAKYHNSCMKKFYCPPSSGEKRGYRPATNVDEAMEAIYSYLEENSEECQFSLDELMDQIEGDYRPDCRTVKSRLLQKYGDDIVIAMTASRPTIVCFLNTGYKVITDTWYASKKTDSQQERLRIVQTAATIVLEDIRSQVYETKHYPPSDNFLQDVDTIIPDTLRTFLQGVILKNKRGPTEKWQTKCTALAHSIISAVRPRSFLSSLHVGVGAFLYKKFGSRQLINMLSSLGFCSSYSESLLFEISAVMRPGITIEQNAFSQFVFDSADFNTNTLDGLSTFHAMEGIHCVTPKTAIAPDQVIPRLSRMPSAKVVGQYGSVPMQVFERNNESGLQKITIVDLEEIHPISSEVVPSASDFLWLYGKYAGFSSIPGWNGFMEQATISEPFQKSQVLCLPFINSPPSDYDTIFTALRSAVEKCKSLNQRTCFVTFDQPLYIKARDIISSCGPESELSDVVVRLGGFHLLMSYMGSIGYIMAGSGLKDLLSIIYAQNSVEKMLTGHAYARGIRAHILCHLALATIVLQTIDFTDEDRHTMEIILHNMNRSVILSAEEESSYQTVAGKFKSRLLELEENGPTAKLWVQYFCMVTLIKQFVEAERMGCWELHLDTIQKMLPYFHASGHFFYAKACHLYLQDMLSLADKMDPSEYANFTKKGYFTIRRSDKFWSGIWSDMTIEQTLMRSMKSVGGLTRGRGLTDSVLTMWTLGMVYLHNVCDGIENFCRISMATTEQHVDMRSSRIIRDDKDLKNLIDWFSSHPPFQRTDDLISISTGVVGDERINCHNSREIGILALSKIVGNNFDSVKFKRSDKVIPLAVINSGIKIKDVVIPIDPLLLYQRMCVAKQSDEDLQEYLQFELAPFPLALFNEEGMRKGTKSSLYKAFTPVPDDTEFGNSIYVIDGGYLLHRVIWHRNESFASICTNYVQYVQRHYSSNTIIVFDGYPIDAATKSTKSAERHRRSNKQTSADVHFNESMVPTVPQERFFSNETNKIRLISMLKKKFENSNFTVEQAMEDADTLIVNTAINMSASFDSVFIVGEDIDLLVLLTALAKSYPNVYFHKPGRGKSVEQIYSPRSLQYAEVVAENILFLHAFGGCDTTSAVFNAGKMKFMRTLEKNEYLSRTIQAFKEQNADPEVIASAGETFLIALYGVSKQNTMTLGSLRYQNFARSMTKSKFNLAALPPTKEAARQHSFRTYHQVQAWCNVHLSPDQWGWQRSKTGLTPVTTTKDPAPEALLKFISCKCKKGCGRACGCRKTGLKCSVICTCSNGHACENSPEIFAGSEGEEEDDENEDPTVTKLLTFQDQEESEDENSGEKSDFQEDSVISEPGPSRASKRKRK